MSNDLNAKAKAYRDAIAAHRAAMQEHARLMATWNEHRFVVERADAAVRQARAELMTAAAGDAIQSEDDGA